MTRVLTSLALILTLAGCGAGNLTASQRASAQAAALGKTAGGKQKVGAIVDKDARVSPVPANVKRAFAALDRNGDKRLVAAEWPATAKDVAAGAPAFEAADAGRDGAVTAAEWEAFAGPRWTKAAWADVDVPKAYKAALAENETTLSADRMQLLIKALPAAARAALYLNDESMTQLFRTGDADGDFALDEAEVQDLVVGLMVRRFFDAD